jgi:hypothetical protein
MRKWIGNLEGILIMTGRNQKWEEGDVTPVTMPTETYGVCIKPRCSKEGDLANGLCQRCWDSGSGGSEYQRLRASSGSDRGRQADVPIIIIS